jgi:class 3 adenylate cyclase
MRGPEVSGIAVWIAARVMSVAGPCEILVSESMRAPVVDAGIDIRDQRTYTLKGLPGEWPLYSVGT